MHQRFVQPLRIAIQWCYLLFMLYLGIRFAQFVHYVRAGGTASFVPRPAGIEGFLPISGLLGVKDWLAHGDINPIHPAAVVIFLAIIGVSLLFKRSFCSWICPVGTISELLWKTGFKTLRRNIRLPRWLDVLLRGIKYLLLAFFLVSILWQMPSTAVSSFIYSDYHKVADVRLLAFFQSPSAGAVAFILILALLSIPVRNAFCRYLCPYGALLGLISTLSPIKVTRSHQQCVSCGACSQVCPAYLPVMAKERMHSPECIGCWRCISHCRASGALEMKLTGSRLVINGILFAIFVVAGFWGATLAGKLSGHWQTSITLADYARLLGK